MSRIPRQKISTYAANTPDLIFDVDYTSAVFLGVGGSALVIVMVPAL